MSHPESSTNNYPEVKVVEELKPLQVAACHVVGPNPEMAASGRLIAWAREVGIPWKIGDVRRFGFDNPDTCDPANEGKPHGYESWMTIPDRAMGTGSIKLKTFTGGLYATMKTTVGEVGQSWQRLTTWLDSSKYSHGDHQWLEEVLAAGSENEADTQLKIMMPIRESV